MRSVSIATDAARRPSRHLHATSQQQLQLLNQQLSGSPVAITVVPPSLRSVGNGTSGGTSNNNLLDALNKIVVNTKLTIDAIGVLHDKGIGSFVLGSTVPTGALAAGGTIPPYGLALVSEHSPGGGRFLRAGSEPITVSPYAPSEPAPYAPSVPAPYIHSNDNGAVQAELRSLRDQVDKLTKVVANGLTGIANATLRSNAKASEAVVEAIDEQTTQQRRDARHAASNPRGRDSWSQKK